MVKYSKNLNTLFSSISDLEQCVKDGKIAIYPFFKYSKKPFSKKGKDGKYHTLPYNKQISLKKFRDDDNISLVIGFDNKDYGIHLGALDIDGYKVPNDKSKWYDSKIHNKVCDDLYNVLKDLAAKTIQVKSWSNGYHIYFFTDKHFETSDIISLKFIKFPNDYPIEELQGKGINEIDNFIEVFSKNNRRMVTYPSFIKEKRENTQRMGKYELLSENPSIQELFDNPISDLESLLIDVFSKNGFIFDEDGYNQAIANKSAKKRKVKTYKNKGTSKTNGKDLSDSYKLTPKLKKSLITEIGSIIDKTIGKHNEVIIALDGGFSNLGLSDDDRFELISSAIYEKDNNNEHIKQLEHSINNDKIDKTGFNTIITLEPKTKENILRIKELFDKAKDKHTKESLKPISVLTDDLKRAMNDLLYQSDNNPKVIKSIEKNIESLRKAVYPFDLYYEVYNKASDKSLRLKLAKEVIDDFNIKSYYDVNLKKDVLYYLNDDGYYEKLNESLLKSLIYDSRNCNYNKAIVKDIIESIPRNSNKNDNLIQFSNVVFDNSDLSYVPIDNFNIKENLVHKKIGVKDERTGKITLLTYYPNARLTDDESKRTYVEKKLREIYVPKNNQDDVDSLIDRLERSGATILGITNKTITYNYDDKGGSGKSTMNHIHKLVLNDLYINIGAKAFKQTFTSDLFSYKHSINIDETTPKELEEIIQELKKHSSNNFSINDRLMYSDESISISGFGNIEIFSNYLFTPNLDDNGFINRIDIKEYPNLFRKKEELHKYDNAYLEDSRTYDKLNEDIDGLSWFVSAAINYYMDIYPNGKFRCYQTNEQVLDILGNSDVYSQYVYLYLKKDNENLVTNKEIKVSFIEYAKRKGKLVKDSDDKIGKKLGLTIKKMYGKDIKKRTTFNGKNDTFYSLRIRTFDEVESYSQRKLIAISDDYLTESDLINVKLLDENQKLIYKHIKNNELNSIKQLKDNYTSIDVVRIVKDLKELNLIEDKENYQLDDYQ